MLRLLILFVFSLMASCIGPLKELDRQIDDVYLSSPLDGTPEELPENFVNKVEIKKLWSFEFSDLSDETAPVIDEEFLYLLTRDGRFLKLSLDSGAVVFEKQLNANVDVGLFGASKAQNFFFIDSNNYLTKINNNAEISWRVRLSKKVDLLPLVYENQIIIKYKNNDIESFDLDTSLSLWVYQKPNPPLSIDIQSPLIIADNIIYTGFPGGKIIIIDPESGSFLTELSVTRASGVTEIDRAKDISGEIAIIDSILYAASYNGEIAAFDRTNGSKIWSRKISSYFGVKTDNVNLILTHEDDAIYNFDKNTGKTVWKANFMKFRKASRPIIFNDYVLTTDYLGIFHIISLEEGELMGMFNFGKGFDGLVDFNTNESIRDGVNQTRIFKHNNSIFVFDNSNIHKLTISNE
jgi:outer membrane protein assembly factor BamB